MTHQLGVRLLGEFRLDGADLAALKSRQARTVLKRLAIAEGFPVAPDTLAEAVWGQTISADPARDLYVLLSRARGIVGAGRLVRREVGYVLLADSWDRVDLVALTRDAARRRDLGDLAGAATAAEAALALVRGPLLADGPDADWVLAERAVVDSVIAEARMIAASAALAAAGWVTPPTTRGLRSPRIRTTKLPCASCSGAGRRRSTRERSGQVRDVPSKAALRARHRPESGYRGASRQILRGEPIDVQRSRPAGRLVGREEALRTLDEALASPSAATTVVIVTGEPGIGKTALLDQWIAQTRARGVVTLEARAEPGGASLQPVVDALATRLGSVPRLENAFGAVPMQGASAAALNREVFAQSTTP